MTNRNVNFWIAMIFCLVLTDLKSQTPLAEGKPKWLGNIYSSAQLTDFTLYWNQVTPENAGKWGSVEGTRDSFNWGPLDASYALAKDNGFPFRFHVLLWGNQQPNWITNLSNEEQLAEINEWMDAVAERYPDIDYLEVVNEPINDPPSGVDDFNYTKALGGPGVTGYDWLIEAYRMARTKFPNAQLVINEYNIVNNENNVRRYKRIIELLMDDDLLDVIGVQAHAFSTRVNVEVIKNNLDELASTGLPIMATELDIDGGENFDNDDNLQLTEYQRIFPVFWEHRAVIGVTLWGWRPGLWRNDEAAYLINRDGDERPALGWLRNYVKATQIGRFGVLSTPALPTLELYPNPSSTNTFSINAARPLEYVEVIDLSGNVIHQQTGLNDTSLEIQLKDAIASGVYVVRIRTQDGKELSRRIVFE